MRLKVPKLRQQTFIPSLSSATAEAKAWGHAIRIDPNYATAFYNRGSTYTELRDFDRAIQDFDQAIGLDPNLTKAFVNHDFLSATKSGYDRAVRDFDEAIRLDPNFAQAYLNRGIAKLRKGDSTGAPTSIERRCPILTSAIEISDLLMRRGLVQRDDEAAAALLAAGVALDRLDIYRNTIVTGLTKSLRLSFPAVERLVGGDFFDGAAQCFIASYPPREAYLDRYGSELPDFLRDRRSGSRQFCRASFGSAPLGRLSGRPHLARRARRR